MKQIVLITLLCFAPSISRAQADTIPNAGFESWWFFGWGLSPADWFVNNSQILASNVVPDSDSYAGSTAMMLINSGNFRPLAYCGFPLLHHPIALNGFIKNQLNFSDTAIIHIRIFSNGQPIDSASQIVTGGIIIQGYFPFTVPVSQNSTAADSCEIMLEGGNSYLSMISFDDLSLTLSTGIDDIPETERFGAYPNPCRDLLFARWDNDFKEVQLILRDAMGRTVSKQIPEAAHENVEMDLSTLAAGVYLLTLETGSKSITKKILKYE